MLSTRSLRLPRAFVLSALLPLGCVSISLHELTPPAEHGRAVRNGEAGLAAACRLVTAPEEARFFFGADLIALGILPLIVQLENASGDTLRFSASDARVTLADGATLVHLPWSAAAEAASFSYWRAVPGFLFAVIPGLVIADSVALTNARIAGHYRHLAVEEAALPPGARKLGAVFFAPRDGGKLDGEAAARGAEARLPFARRAEPNAAPRELLIPLPGAP